MKNYFREFTAQQLTIMLALALFMIALFAMHLEHIQDRREDLARHNASMAAIYANDVKIEVRSSDRFTRTEAIANGLIVDPVPPLTQP